MGSATRSDARSAMRSDTRSDTRSLPARCRAVAVAVAGVLSACGGGGDSAPAAASTAPVQTTPPVAATTRYARSVVLGSAAPQDLVYAPASGSTPATVTATTASTLLRVGANILVAEHVDPLLGGMRVACVSGDGQSTNVVTDIDLGVIAESAAVLLDTTWTEIDPAGAWTAAIGRGSAYLGWENCGVKPEGLPSPSSRLTPATDGGYREDVYDGNPSTTFNIVTRRVSATVVAAMLSDAGYVTVDDPTRPLVLKLRAYRDAAGDMIFVERGEPAAGAPSGTHGFVALYVPATS